MMNGEYQLVIDTWEGQLEIDEAVLLDNGVAGMIIRLNDMNGGHHMDELFPVQWEQAKAFCRAPYFVYNPWVNGFANYTWLANHMPSDAKAVLLDIEVRMSGYPPATYATEVRKFHDLVRAKWTTAIYTGEWFLPILSSWPTADYWWAQYPFEFFQEQDIHLTWDELRTRLQRYDKPLNASKIPGPLRMWQFSGNTLILPGNPRIMDVNVFYGSRADLESWLGKPAISQPPFPTVEHTQPYPGVDEYIQVVNGVRCHITVINMAGKQLRVKHFAGALRLASQAARSDGAQVVFNGDDYAKNQPAPHYPRSLAYSDGVKYRDQFEFRKFFNCSKNNVMKISHTDLTSLYNTTSFTRPLITNGVKEDYLNDPNKIENTEIHARSALGITNNGRLIQVVAEGKVDPETGVAYQGITLPQLADLLLQYGARDAGEHGGGGDSGKWIQDKMVNAPSDPVERPVVQVIEIFIEGASMATAISKTHELSVRPLHQAINSSTIIKIPVNTAVPVSDVWKAPETTAYNNKDDLWALVAYGGKTGWVGLVHLGIRYGTTDYLISEPEPEPPATPAFPNEIGVTVGSVTKTYVLKV